MSDVELAYARGRADQILADTQREWRRLVGELAAFWQVSEAEVERRIEKLPRS